MEQDAPMPCVGGDRSGAHAEPSVPGQQLLHQTVEEERLKLAYGRERLRQEQVTFDTRVRGAQLQILVGVVSIPLLIAVFVVTTWILLNHEKFSTSIVTPAAGLLFGDIVTLLAMVWKIVLSPNFLRSLRPVTGEGKIKTVGQITARKEIEGPCEGDSSRA